MTFFNLTINKSIIKCFIPDLLILIVALISRAFIKTDLHLSYAPVATYVNYILLFILIILSIYIKLYIWRNRNISIKSFIFFLSNIIQLILYTWSIYFLLFSLQGPIYLKDLSLISQYRHLLFFILIVISILLYIVFYLSSYQIPFNVSVITFPYLKEEIRLILYTWNDSVFNPICSKIIEHLYIGSHRNRVVYFILHFILFNVPRFISTLLFTYFILGGGDLRYVMYMLPLLFIKWLLSLFDYYFNVFFEGTCTYIRLVLNVKANTIPTSVNGIVSASLEDMNFTLTEYGINEGFNYQGLTALIRCWDQCAQLSVYFSFYKRFLSRFNLFLNSVKIINYFCVVYIFFLKSSMEILFATGVWSVFRRKGTCLILPYNPNQGSGIRHIEASHVKQQFQKQMYNYTGGVQQGNHPPIIDPQDRNPEKLTEIRYLGQATHGLGTNVNPSEELHPATDLLGKLKSQRFIPVKGRHYYDDTWFNPSIPGSKHYLETDPARANLIKHRDQEENT